LRLNMPEVDLGLERREWGRRAEVVRAIVSHIVQNAEAAVTLQSLEESLHIPPEAASRIVERLVSAGVVIPVRAGVWMRSPQLPPACL
jgi:DNA-binding Lrp family transcriptional regulator